MLTVTLLLRHYHTSPASQTKLYVAETDLFSQSEKLSLLDLSHNSIIAIDERALAGLSIGRLELGYNSLRRLPAGALARLAHLGTLVLSGNPVEVLTQAR